MDRHRSTSRLTPTVRRAFLRLRGLLWLLRGNQVDPINKSQRKDANRRRLRRCLGCLLALLLAAGILATWFAFRWERAARQREAVNVVRRMGGWSFYNCRFDESGNVTQFGAPGWMWLRRLIGDDFLGTVHVVHLAGDDDLEGLRILPFRYDHGLEVPASKLLLLRHLPDLKWLALSHSQVNDRVLQETLVGLTELQKLWLTDTPITDAGLPYLAGLSQLERLWLDDTAVTDAGLKDLRGLVRLRTLSLKGTRVTDAGLVHLTEMTGLETLSLDGTQCSFSGVIDFLSDVHGRGIEDAIRIAGYAKWTTDENVVSLDLSLTRLSDAGLIHVKRLPKVQWLFLQGTQVTDAGLVHLQGLEYLTMLNLAETQVTDDGLEYLQDLPQLRTLHLEGTRATATGIERLRQQTSGRVRAYLSPLQENDE